MLAPEWLTARVDYREIKFIYRIVDGASRLKGGENTWENGGNRRYAVF